MLHGLSGKYATPLWLEPAGSRTLWLLLLTLYLATLSLACLVPVPGSVRLLMAVVLAVVPGLWLTLLPLFPVRRLVWLEGCSCWIESRAGATRMARLESRAFVSPWLVILYYRTGRWRTRALLLLPDMLDAVTWRRLRVRLRTQLCSTDDADGAG